MRKFNVVTTTVSRNVFAGNGATTTFPLDFQFIDDTDLIATLVETDGTELVKSLTTDYTVSGGDGSTGTVETTSFTPASGESLVVQRFVDQLQLTDLIPNSQFAAQTVETALDKIVMMIQALQDDLNVAASFEGNLTDDPDNPTPTTFPSPVDENVLVGTDGNAWELRAISQLVPGAGSPLGAIRIFTSSDTWTKPSILDFAIVECQGGGGGGGGCSTTAAEASAGGGGGGGGYSWEKLDGAGLAASETVTVGGGGAGGTAGNNSGSAGGTSSFGAFVTATGGLGGAGMAATALNTNANGGDGGSGSGGDYNSEGSEGHTGIVGDSDVYSVGHGGNSPLGGGARGDFSGAGRVGNNYGGGGSGAANADSQTQAAGGAGAPGVVIVLEFG